MRHRSRCSMRPKQAYQQKLEAQLREWDGKIDDLRAKADRVQAEARIEYYKQIEEFCARRELVEKSLLELRHASEEAWQELQANTEAAWTELKRAFEAATSRLP